MYIVSDDKTYKASNSDGNKVAKLKTKSFWQQLCNYFREYCEYTSIHGIKYFGENRTTFEKCWWFFVCTLSLSTCIFLIIQIYNKWERSPVIVSFATRETRIHEIPFPAVTICPESKTNTDFYSHAKVLKMIFKGENVTNDEKNLYNYMNLICDELFPSFLLNDLNPNETVTDHFFQELVRLNILENLTLSEWKFMGKERTEEIFSRIITDEGLCITFNMQDRTEIFRDNVVHYSDFLSISNYTPNQWSMFKGYSKQAPMDAYPFRALLSGQKNGLQLNLAIRKKDIDYHCKTSLQGFRVILHIPSRFPSASQDYFRVPLNSVVIASVTPTMITTAKSLENYSPNIRNCYFPNEKRLALFKTYTFLNCKFECLTNFTLKTCKCVNFHMPRVNGTPICGTPKKECMMEAENNLQIAEVYQQTKNTDESKKHLKFIQNCQCLPMCYDLTYNVQTSSAKFYWQDLLKAFSNNDTYIFKEDIALSSLTIYFKSSQFITSQRNELYGPTDFVANFGGLLGLFTGFSVLSLMEILYFLSVRLICNTRLYGYWAGSNQN